MISGTAAAASFVFTVMRTISDPASASSTHWRAVATASAVSVIVIDCTTTGAPPPVPGVVGNALRCDGVDDRARMADFAWGTSGVFSLAFWFKTSDTTSTGSRYLVSHGGTASANRLGVYFDQASGTLPSAQARDNGAMWMWVVAPGTPAPRNTTP